MSNTKHHLVPQGSFPERKYPCEQDREEILRLLLRTYRLNQSQNELQDLVNLLGIDGIKVTAFLNLAVKQLYWIPTDWQLAIDNKHHLDPRLSNIEVEQFVNATGIRKPEFVEWLALQEAYRTENSWAVISQFWKNKCKVDVTLVEGEIRVSEQMR